MVWVSEPPTVMVGDSSPSIGLGGGNVPNISNQRGRIWLGTAWNITVALTASGQTYTVDINAGTSPNIIIDWGDGVVEQHTTTGQKTHTYLIARTVIVKIRGEFASGGNIRLGSNAANRARVRATSAIPFIPGLANFQSTFQDCTSLTSIPADLFRYNPAVSASGFHGVFRGCTSLASIPTDLFRYNTAVSTSGFRDAIRACTSLTSLPTDLFRYNTAVSTSGFYAVFYDCTRLASLPTDLFRYNTAVSSSGFEWAFYNCTSLTSLPTDLFRYNTALSSGAFSSAFRNCTGLTSLPTDLFRYNTALSSGAFVAAFQGCTGLTSLPTDIFRYNTAISTSGFYSTFQNCTGLESLPTDLFRYNTACSSFYETFRGCTKLQQNATIFYADGEQSTRFLNKTVDFTRCFNITSFTGTTGVAPDLWNCDFGTGAATTTDCWQGHSVSTVSNFADIPAAWT